MSEHFSQSAPIEKPAPPQLGDRKIDNGIVWEWAPSGYTLRSYFSHSTPGLGPGPGWDYRWGLLEDPDAAEARYGHRFTDEEVNNPALMPELPVHTWKPVGEASDQEGSDA